MMRMTADGESNGREFRESGAHERGEPPGAASRSANRSECESEHPNMRAAARRAIRGGLSIGLAFVCAALAGCGGFSVRQLGKLDASEELAYQSLACDKTFAIREYRYPVYSEHLLSVLKRTRCADSFFKEGTIDDYDYVVEIERPIYGNSSVPVAFILSFGIIPVRGQERYGYVLRVTGRDGRSVVVDESGECEFVMGWVAVFYNLSEDWAMHSIERDETYFKRLAISLSHADSTGRAAESIPRRTAR
jgi:hypothetical protein